MHFIMKNTQVKSILQDIKNERRGGAPRDGWVSQNRDILMMQVRNTTDASTRRTFGEYVRHFFGIFVPMESVMVTVRATGVFLLMIGIVLGGGLTSAQLYGGAVPGDMFYGMKLAVEKAQLTLAPNDEYRTRLHTEFADKRMDEVARLAEGSVLQQQNVPLALTALEGELLALHEGLSTLAATDPEGVVEVAKLLERKMAVYQKMLRTASMTLPADVRIKVAFTRNLMDDLSISALAVIVERYLAGHAQAPRTVVISKLGQHVDQAEDALAVGDEEQNDLPEAKVRAQAAIAQARVLIEKEQYQAALLKIEEVAELTKGIEEEAMAEDATASDDEQNEDAPDEDEDEADGDGAEEPDGDESDTEPPME